MLRATEIFRVWITLCSTSIIKWVEGSTLSIRPVETSAGEDRGRRRGNTDRFGYSWSASILDGSRVHCKQIDTCYTTTLLPSENHHILQ